MANYLNFTKAIFNPYNPKVLNEGQFSWITYDTDIQIGSERENTIDVYMYDNEGNQWYEKKYEGYGEFGGMDYYELLAKMNGYTAEDLKKGQEMRDLGIDLAFKKLKTKDKGRKVLFPALVEDPKFNWKRHDFTQEAESDPNQSWYQEEESDDDYDDDYEQGWYENIQPTHEGVMSDINQMIGNHKSFDSFEKEFFKEYGHKKVMKRTPEFLEWLEALYNDYEYAAVEKKELTWDSLKESLGLNEGRSINKISKEHAATVVEMSNTVKEWKEAEGDRKAELLEKLRALNAQKAELEKELDDAVAGKDRNVQLALEEAEKLAYLEIDIKNILEVNGQEK
tara:strand:- start:589 stop:1602 length:1014 start_codon:yes stop_codon:yes gene_type:complete